MYQPPQTMTGIERWVCCWPELVCTLRQLDGATNRWTICFAYSRSGVRQQASLRRSSIIWAVLVTSWILRPIVYIPITHGICQNLPHSLLNPAEVTCVHPGYSEQASEQKKWLSVFQNTHVRAYTHTSTCNVLFKLLIMGARADSSIYQDMSVYTTSMGLQTEKNWI